MRWEEVRDMFLVRMEKWHDSLKVEVLLPIYRHLNNTDYANIVKMVQMVWKAL